MDRKSSLLSYSIKLNDRSVLCRHVDSVKARTTEIARTEQPADTAPTEDFEETVCILESTDDQDVTSELVSSSSAPIGLATDEPAELGLRRST